VESAGGEEFHTSRNRFIPVAEVSAEDKAVLLQSIWKWPELKEIAGMREHVDKLWDQVDRKQAVHRQLLATRVKVG
jgi:hypothetical protein